MKPFDVYPLYDVNIVRGKGCNVWDSDGQEYLDLYGGHAVISIGHSHPHYIECITRQLNRLGFYSNSVINKLQEELAERLGKASGYDDYSLFLINSGAEANENALKLASFQNGRTRVLAASHALRRPCMNSAVASRMPPTPCMHSIMTAHTSPFPNSALNASRSFMGRNVVCPLLLIGALILGLSVASTASDVRP